MAARRPRPLWPLAVALFLALLLLGPQAADAQDAAKKKKKKKKNKKPSAGNDVFGSFAGQPARPAEPAPAPDFVPPPPTATTPTTTATDIPKTLMDAVDAAVDHYGSPQASTQPSFPNLENLVCDVCPDFEPPTSGSGSPLERVQEWFEVLEELVDGMLKYSEDVYLLARLTKEWVEGA